MLFGQLLGPFTDVICIFASDVGGLWGVVRFLSHWRDQLRVGLWLPEVVVIRESPPDGSPDPIIDSLETQLLYDMVYSTGASCMPEMKVVVVSDRDVMMFILARCHRARERRLLGQTLYSFHHMLVLFQQACNHIVKTIDFPFNPIIASRYQNPVPSTLVDCLTSFLHLLDPEDSPSASRLIASSIAFNAMPPGVHGM